MSGYKIFTDSSCDLPADLLESIGAGVINLSVYIDEIQYLNYPDWHGIDPHVYFDMLRDGTHSKTSAPCVDAFKAEFEPAIKEGNDILYIGFSSTLSGTFNSGRLALAELNEKYPERKLIALDSMNASMGQGMLVYLAAQRRDTGASIEETAVYADEMKLKICHWFTVDDLFHLKRGGRVSAATAIIGTTLGIKPVMHMDSEGHLTKTDTARGRKSSIKVLAERLADGIEDTSLAYIVHGDCYEDAERLAEMIKARGVENVLINYLGPVIGAHSGPGTLAVFYIGNNR